MAMSIKNLGGGGVPCAKCSKDVFRAELIRYNDSVFHPECFVCIECHRLLGPSEGALYGGQIYCDLDWKRLRLDLRQAELAVKGGDGSDERPHVPTPDVSYWKDRAPVIVHFDEEEDDEASYPQWRENAAVWKERYPTADAQAEYFCLRFGNDSDITRDAVFELLKQFKDNDSVGAGELEEKDALTLLALRGFTDVSLVGMREMVKNIDMDHNRRLSFLEWACAIFKRKWKQLHATSSLPDDVEKVKALIAKAGDELTKSQKLQEEKAEAIARAKAMKEASEKGMSDSEAKIAAAKAAAEALTASKAEFDARLARERQERAAAQARLEAAKKAATGAGVRGKAGMFDTIALDKSVESKLSEEERARRAAKKIELEQQRKHDLAKKEQEHAKQLAEDKARAEAESVKLAAEKAAAEAEAKRLEDQRKTAEDAVKTQELYAKERAKAEAEAKRIEEETMNRFAVGRQSMAGMASKFGEVASFKNVAQPQIISPLSTPRTEVRSMGSGANSANTSPASSINLGSSDLERSKSPRSVTHHGPK